MNNDIQKKIEEATDRWASRPKNPLNDEQRTIVENVLGWSGMMISGSKRPIISKGKEHFPVFNANVIVDGHDKVWYGDIDITLSEPKLVELAKRLGKKVYVLREMDARFDYENSPQIQNAVYSTDGTTSDFMQEYYERTNGKIYRKEKKNVTG